VYDGVGYDILFKIEGEGDIEKGDVSMHEASGGDDKESPSEHPEDNLPEDPSNGDINSLNNSPRMADLTGKHSSNGRKQVASEPLHVCVGLFDCVEGDYSLKSAPPKILWGDRDDAESLPSLLPPLKSQPAAAGIGLFYAATTQVSPFLSPSSPAAAELFTFSLLRQEF
jgi:hypothetical protein